MLCQPIRPKWTIKEEKCSSPRISYPFSAALLFRTTLQTTCRIQRLFDSVFCSRIVFGCHLAHQDCRSVDQQRVLRCVGWSHSSGLVPSCWLCRPILATQGDANRPMLINTSVEHIVRRTPMRV